MLSVVETLLQAGPNGREHAPTGKRFLVGAILGLSAATGLAAEFHVAKAGSDANAGTRNQPFASLQAAADRMAAGDTCYVHGGVYRQAVRVRKSGQEGRPVRFAAVPGERVVLDGTEVIQSPRQPWQNGIYKTSCAANFEQLFVGGRMMVEARWPNARFDDRWNRDKWADSATGSRKDLLICTALKQSGIDWTGATAVLNVAHQYRTWVRKVLVGDPLSGSFRYELGERLGDGADDGVTWADDKFYLFGKLEALDAPGEWFLDSQSQSLYYYPDNGIEPGKTALAYKARNLAFEADNADFIELAGFEFFGTTFAFRNCNHCVIEDCRLRFPTFSRLAGKESVAFTRVVGSYNTIRRTSLAWSNVGGLAISGSHNRVEDCIVHDVNWLGDYGYAGITVNGPENCVRRCSVSCMGNIGILYNGGKNEIAYNHVFDTGKACKDIAAVHTGGVECRGSEAHHNWIHHSSGTGLRGDDQTRGLIVHHNVIWDCDDFGMTVKGDDNCVFHNTLIGGRGGVFVIPTLPEPKKWWTRHPTLATQNPNSRYHNNAGAMLWWQLKSLADKSHFIGNRFGEELSDRWIGKMRITASNVAWFRNAAALDFRPAATSPLIGAGVPIQAEGSNPPRTGIDIGAYQRNEPYWVPGATWVDTEINLPPEVVEVARRTSPEALDRPRGN